MYTYIIHIYVYIAPVQAGRGQATPWPAIGLPRVWGKGRASATVKEGRSAGSQSGGQAHEVSRMSGEKQVNTGQGDRHHL